jgi:hypothetical protein
LGNKVPSEYHTQNIGKYFVFKTDGTKHWRRRPYGMMPSPEFDFENNFNNSAGNANA